MEPPWLPADPLPPDVLKDLRRRAVFEFHKWDQQVGDVATFAGFPILLKRSAWDDLCALATALAGEALAAETELLGRPDLHRRLGLPYRLRRAMRAAASRPAVGIARLMRFDFHATRDGWRISEVNSDVPGGMNESSGYPRLLAPHHPAGEAPPDISDAYATALMADLQRGASVGLVYATAYTDDHQVMAHMADTLAQRGANPHLCAPDQLRWREGLAHAVLNDKRELRLDRVARFFPAEWLPALPARSGWTSFFANATTPISNPAYAVLTQTKRFPLVWDHLVTPLPTWRTLLPATRPLSEVDWRRGEAWVIKPSLGRVGSGIGIRGITPAKEWQDIRRAATWSPSYWVAQERFEPLHLANAAGVWYPCIGVYTVDGRVAGAYGRVASAPLVNHEARDAAVLVERRC